MIREHTMDQLHIQHNENITELEMMLTRNRNSSVTQQIRSETIITTQKTPDILKSAIEILISVSIHTFIMAVFEIYFYFEYIIVIEKEMFMDKILQYTQQVNREITNMDPNKKEIIYLLFPKNDAQLIIDYLYNEYKKSLEAQHKLLEILLIRAYKMLSVITSILVLLLMIGVYKYKTVIKWKHITVENILMFIFLGVFEYLFFINIILHYTPVTDAEIKYTVMKELLMPFTNRNTTHSHYFLTHNMQISP